MQPQNDNPQPDTPNTESLQPLQYQPQVVQPQQAVTSSTADIAPANGVYVATMPGVPLEPAEPAAPKKHVLRTFSLALVAVLVVSGILAGGFVMGGGLDRYSNKHATAAATEYISFLNNDQTAKAYQASSSNLRKNQTETQFANSLGDLTAKNPKFENQSMQVKGNKAVYTATIDGLPATSTGRTDGVFTLALVKHGLASWQVDSIQVQ